MTKRTERPSVLITVEAMSLLKELSIKLERSQGWLLDRMIKKYLKKEDDKVIVKSKPKQNLYPINIDDNFEILWQEKGKKGAKQKALDLFKELLVNADENTCGELTFLLVNDIKQKINDNEIGFDKLHLTTYLNQKRWEK